MLTTTLLQAHPGEEDEDEDEEADTDETSFQFDLSTDGGFFQSQDQPSPSFYTQEQTPQETPQQPPQEIYQQPPQETPQQPPQEIYQQPPQEIYQQPPQEIYQQPPGEEFFTQESFIFGPGAVSGPSEPQERLFGEIPDPPQPEPILPPGRPRRDRRARVRYTPSSR